MNVQILELIEGTTKRAPKENLLAMLDEQGKRLVKMTLDPDITYGITDDGEYEQFEPEPVTWTAEKFWNSLEALLPKLAARELTGNAANSAAQDIFEHAPSRIDLKWATRILNKNLRAGFDIKTFNKVFGEGAVEKFTVQLAETYDPDKHELEGLWLIQPKLDGNRVLLLDGKAYSRNGKLYAAAQHVVDEITTRDPSFFKKWVVDGEMMGNLGFDQSSGALRRLDSRGNKAQFTYWAFDLIRREEWEARKTSILKTRRVLLETHLQGFKLTKIVPTEELIDPTHKQLIAACEKHLANGFEGAMAKDAMAQYQWGRHDNLLKVKKFYDADLKVVGFYEGKGQHKGTLGGIVVEGVIDGKLIRSEVGSGFSHVFNPKKPDAVLRQDVWKDKKGWMNAVVQVQYQEITPKNSLRFPVFVMRRKDKE